MHDEDRRRSCKKAKYAVNLSRESQALCAARQEGVAKRGSEELKLQNKNDDRRSTLWKDEFKVVRRTKAVNQTGSLYP